jgi:hypothetical protein
MSVEDEDVLVDGVAAGAATGAEAGLGADELELDERGAEDDFLELLLLLLLFFLGSAATAAAVSSFSISL